ncbi:glycosyltransferase [Serinicoccus marinus]|uniref:glycosyltransferase n=1 Tax=Serinicoccus marinus TaxID=247333 RepID=UPI0004090A27|nr:glycosyltransferase [Serinicoccus marinus]
MAPLTLAHLVPGPAEHGVVRHGVTLHPHLGDAELLRPGTLEDLPEGALAGRTVLAQVTDRLLARQPAGALPAWRRACAGAARVTVVLHDLPQASDGRWRADRVRLYAALAAGTDAVVVASEHERLLLRAAVRHARGGLVADAVDRRTHVVPLPVDPLPGAVTPDRPPVEPRAGGPRSVVTLGYLYPGKGLEQVIDATAAAAREPALRHVPVVGRNLGRASRGHEDLPDLLADRARRAGVSWSTTGWVADEALPGLLAAATVPVAGHQHVSASGSIATWLAAGRRPLVLRSRYTSELAHRLPGAVQLVEPGGLARAVTTALLDPDLTWLGEGVTLGPSSPEAARAVREVADRPACTVVVPYYRDQPMLDLVLARLDAQRGVLGGLEVVVADDGSPTEPVLRPVRLPVTVVRQPDLGFRLAAARNLGATRAQGRVIVFLDGDTAPEDDYVATLQRACLEGPTLAVGRRRHARLGGAGTDQDWPPSACLTEPGWLREGYAATRDLRDADDTSFRYVIGAVSAISRDVFEAVGGYDETLTGYGGEDWDLAWRAWLAGARLRHEPAALAWHDGPDLAGRHEGDAAGLARLKNAETAALAERIPHPLVRGRGWHHTQPDVVAVLGPGCASWSPGQLVVVVEALLRLGDLGVWVPHPAPVPPDPRVHRGDPPGRVLARCRAVVEVTRPEAVLRLPWPPGPAHLTLGAPPGADLDDAGDNRDSGVRVRSTRREGEARWEGAPAPTLGLPGRWVEPVPADVVVEHWRQRHP